MSFECSSTVDAAVIANNIGRGRGRPAHSVALGDTDLGLRTTVHLVLLTGWRLEWIPRSPIEAGAGPTYRSRATSLSEITERWPDRAGDFEALIDHVAALAEEARARITDRLAFLEHERR